SIDVKLRATDDEKAPGSVAVTGFVKNLLQSSKPQVFGLALSARNFHAFNKRTLAELFVSTDTLIPGTVRRAAHPLRLTGTSLAPEVTGSILVDRGSIFIPDRELARKLAVQNISDSLNVIDTAAGARSRARSALVSSLMTNLRTRNVIVTLGDVRLRSAEADVKLVGSLNVLTSNQVVRAVPIAAPPFQVEGTLRTA